MNDNDDTEDFDLEPEDDVELEKLLPSTDARKLMIRRRVEEAQEERRFREDYEFQD